jgi:hypothetical protein
MSQTFISLEITMLRIAGCQATFDQNYIGIYRIFLDENIE